MPDTYGAKHKCLMLCATRIIFQRENLNYLIVCIAQCTLFFSTRLFSISNMFVVRYLWKTYVIYMVSIIKTLPVPKATIYGLHSLSCC